jgi:protein-S-isoprenylcysteine O-methyltransferase Ste14
MHASDHQVAIAALWLVWLACWTAAAAGNKPTRRRESLASRAAHILPLGVAVVLMFAGPTPSVPLWAGWLTAHVLAPTDAGGWTGAAIVAAGLGFSGWARLTLGRNWSGTVTVKQDHALIRGGPYRWVRHPIYTGLLAAMAGSAIALDEWRGLVAVALTLYAFLRKIRLEERWMEETFQGRYAAYRSEVKALIPFVL